MKMRLPMAAFALLTAALPVLAQTTAPSPMTLRYKFVPGQAVRYKLTMGVTMKLGGFPGEQPPTRRETHTEMLMTATVQSVAADGTATILHHIDSTTLTVTRNGQPETLPVPVARTISHPRDLSTVVMTPTGKVLASGVGTLKKTAGDDTAPDHSPGMDFGRLADVSGTPEFPAAPVKSGDTWSGTADIGALLSPPGAQDEGWPINLQSTVVAITAGASGATVTFTQIAQGTFVSTQKGKNHSTLQGSSTTVFDAEAGNVLSQTADYTLSVTLTSPDLTTPLTQQVQIHVRRDPQPSK